MEKRLKEKFGSSVVAFADGVTVVDRFADNVDVVMIVKFEAAVVLTPTEALARAVLLANVVVAFRNGAEKLVAVVFKDNEAAELVVVAFRNAAVEESAIVVFKGDGAEKVVVTFKGAGAVKLGLLTLAEAF